MATISEKTLQMEGLSFIGRFVRRFKRPVGPEYASLVDGDEESSLSSDQERPIIKPAQGRWGWLSWISALRYPLYISIFIHSVLAVDLIYAHWRTPCGNYGKGFETDFVLPKDVLALEERVFTHSLRARGNGTIYANIDAQGPRYVGNPSPEVDANWEELIGARYIRLNDGEVSKLNKDSSVADLTTLQRAPGVVDLPGKYASVDMVHSLHCLNTIRQQQDPEYYHAHLQVPEKHYNRMHMQMHIDHCLDHLRQAILCHADLTPVTLRPVKIDDPLAGLVGETERAHTCRNGLGVRRWLTERGLKDGYLPPKFSAHDEEK